MTYSITRKYALKQYENVDFTSEGIENIEDVKDELEKLDKLAEEYRKKALDEDVPSITLRCGNEWFTYNQKEKKLYKNLPKEKIPNQEGEEISKDNKVPF